MLTKGDPVPLDLFVCSNLVQQELTRLGINSIALLNKTDHEWKETMQRLTITERTEKRPVAIRSRVVERDCQSILNQLVKSIPKDVLLRTSYVERQQLTSTQSAQGVSVEQKSSVARRVQFTEAKKEYEPCSDCSSGD